MRKYIIARLTEPSTHAGVAGFLSGIGFILQKNFELGIPSLIAGIFAILGKEKQNLN